MPGWNEILEEFKAVTNHDQIRRKYITELSELRERNVITYYSGFLSLPTNPNIEINDIDKHAFMSVLKGLDKKKGLDLILHTPGGSIAAAESIMDYLHSVFDGNIDIFVPQIAMSAGTMMCCGARKIYMGKHSNLGPTDPHLKGLSVLSVLEEFEKAKEEILQKPAAANYWQFILNKYPPGFIENCEKAKKLAEQVLKKWLNDYMFAGESKDDAEIVQMVENLIDDEHCEHSRHISIEKLLGYGLKVEKLEKKGREKLQDLVLSIHHANMITLDSSGVVKILENQNGDANIRRGISAPAPKPVQS